MTRQEFWQQEFSIAAQQNYENEIDRTGDLLAEDAAIWADQALAEFIKRFPDAY